MTNKKEPISDDFTKALAECIHQAQCNVVDPMVLAETWKDELIKLAVMTGGRPLASQKGEQVDYGKLKTSLDNALSKETKESWEKFLQEEQKTSVWHDANDEPDENVEIVFQWHLIDSEDKWFDTGFYDKELGCFKTVGVLGGCGRVQTKYIIKWAKASDLLKL